MFFLFYGLLGGTNICDLSDRISFLENILYGEKYHFWRKMNNFFLHVLHNIFLKK